MIYLLDTNAISDVMAQYPAMEQHIEQSKKQGHEIASCLPVYYEIMREMKRRNAVVQIQRFQQTILPKFKWYPLDDTDWNTAIQMWADAKNQGFQVKDMDVLIAAIVKRLDAIIVTNDNDFNALPVKRENWRVT